MPFTAFHVVPVWPLYVRWPHRWDVLALSFGAMVPDLEIAFVFPLTGDASLSRGLMHSLLGIVTVNLLVALAAARLLTPWIAGRLDRTFPGRGWRRFAHRDYVADRKPLRIAASSAIVGGLTHLALDLPHHLDTPLLWPWRDAPISLGPWAHLTAATIGMNAVAGILFVVMLVRWVGR